MSWVATAVISSVVLNVGNTLIQQRANKKATKRAKQDALDAEKQARQAEVFAETEGEGIGQLGQISLEVDDDELDEDATVPKVRL